MWEFRNRKGLDVISLRSVQKAYHWGGTGLIFDQQLFCYALSLKPFCTGAHEKSAVVGCWAQVEKKDGKTGHSDGCTHQNSQSRGFNYHHTVPGSMETIGQDWGMSIVGKICFRNKKTLRQHRGVGDFRPNETTLPVCWARCHAPGLNRTTGWFPLSHGMRVQQQPRGGCHQLTIVANFSSLKKSDLWNI